jgi:hypothetical protein
MVFVLILCAVVIAHALGIGFYALHVGAKRRRQAQDVPAMPPPLPPRARVPAAGPSLPQIGVPSGVLYIPGLSERIPKDNRYIVDEKVTAADLDATIAHLSAMTAPYFRADGPLMRRHHSMS